MKSAGKARSNGLYRHIRTSKEIIRNLLNDYNNNINETSKKQKFGMMATDLPERKNVCYKFILCTTQNL